MRPVLSDMSLLSVSALALSRPDTALPAGNHLRWHINSDLGFPHCGFRLRRRPSPEWPWWKSETQNSMFGRFNVATSGAGVHISSLPLRIERAVVTADFELAHAHRGRPLHFLYEARTDSDPQDQPITRFYAALRVSAPALRRRITIRAVMRRDGADLVVAERQMSAGSLPPLSANTSKALRAFTIAAAEAHRIELLLPSGVTVAGAGIATADFLHRQTDWDEIGIFAPLCEPRTADVLAPQDATALARQRLLAARPRRRGGRPDVPGAGPVLSPAAHRSFENRLLRQVGDLAGSLTKAFRAEIDTRTPPGDITLADIDGGSENEIGLPFHGLLQAGAHAAHVAAMLGLGSRDDPPAETPLHDYAVDTLVPAIWLFWRLAPEAVRQQLDLAALNRGFFTLGPLDRVWQADPPASQRLAGFVVELGPQPVPALRAPQVWGRVVPDATGDPVQARLSVRSRPSASGLRTLVWQRAANRVEPISPLDAVTGLMLPAMPAADGLCHFDADGPAAYGPVKLTAVDIDTFGRISAAATRTVDILDLVPPPAPSMPEIDLGDPVTPGALDFGDARLSTFWTGAQRRAAPDLARIRFLWKGGDHDARDVAANPDGSASVGWPTGPVGAQGTNVETRVAVRMGRDGSRRELTVICIADDTAGNASSPSLAARAVLVDEVVPPPQAQPEEPQWSSWPDPDGAVRWTAGWTLPARATHARVSIASEARLLALSGTDADAHYASSHDARAAALKQLAIATPQAFRPEATAYPSTVLSHDVTLTAASDDLIVVNVSFLGETGQVSAWPGSADGFAVVRARGSAWLAAPSLSIDTDGDEDIISVIAAEPGTAEVFALAAPRQRDAVDVMEPLFSGVTDSAPLRHDRSQTPRWLGYTARLRTDDGRVSSPSMILWREKPG